MTIQELRVFLNDAFCGCGSPEDAFASLTKLLRIVSQPQWLDGLKAFVPDEGVQMLLLYQLDKLDLTEHGGSVYGSWLSEKGKEVLAALEVCEQNGESGFLLAGANCCIHGYAVGLGVDGIESELHLCAECGPGNQR